MTRRFQVPTQLWHGPQALDKLRTLGTGPALLVTDPFMASTELCRRVIDLLGEARTTVFDQVEPDPSIEVVANATRSFLGCRPEVVVALGGGSSIDTAKAMVEVARRDGHQIPLGLVVVPTTSGSGSEVTSFAVISDHASHHKLPLIDDDILPEMAILDAAAVVTAPPSITADTGMDVLTHAVEAYSCTLHDDFCDALAEKAVQLVCSNLARCHRQGDDLGARQRMHNASTLAGMSFQNAGLGICHSLAHAIGGSFPVPHGRLNGMLLPHVLRYNAGLTGHTDDTTSATMERIAWLGHLTGGVGENPRRLATSFVADITELARTVGIPAYISDVSVDETAFRQAIPQLAATALADACTATNPRRPTESDLEHILQKLLR